MKKTDKANLFVIFGEPDIDIEPAADPDDEPEWLQVKINGVDVFDPSSGEVRSDGPDGIACWFVDTDYNEESFFVRQAYFVAPLPQTLHRPNGGEGHQPPGRRGDEGVWRLTSTGSVRGSLVEVVFRSRIAWV